jgi:hypothetical protein
MTTEITVTVKLPTVNVRILQSILQVALRAVVLQSGGVSAGRRDWLVVSTIMRQAPGPKWGWC